MSTITATFTRGGVAYDPTSVVLGDSAGAYGWRTADTHVSVYPAGTAMTKSATGVYTKSYTDTAWPQVYDVAIHYVVGGENYYIHREVRSTYTSESSMSGSAAEAVAQAVADATLSQEVTVESGWENRRQLADLADDDVLVTVLPASRVAAQATRTARSHQIGLVVHIQRKLAADETNAGASPEETAALDAHVQLAEEIDEIVATSGPYGVAAAQYVSSEISEEIAAEPLGQLRVAHAAITVSLRGRRGAVT